MKNEANEAIVLSLILCLISFTITVKASTTKSCAYNQPCVVEVPGAYCADGTPAYMNITYRPRATKLLIYLDGGGGCSDAKSCGCRANGTCGNQGAQATWLTRPTKLAIQNWETGKGWGAVNAPQNPFAQSYNVIEIPYCTGDLHIGNAIRTYETDGVPAIVRHVGAKNIEVMLNELKQRFPKPTQIVFSGSSAGGMGATMNLFQLRKVYPNVQTSVFADSGSPNDREHFPRISETFRIWGADTVAPPGVAPAHQLDIAQFVSFNGRMYPEVRYGLAMSQHDSVITYFSFLNGAVNPAATVPGILANFPTQIVTNPSAQKSFIVPGYKHVFMLDSPSSVKIQGISLGSWVKQMIDGERSWESIAP